MGILFDLLSQGKIKPIIAERVPLEEAARAHEMLSSGSVIGRIVLICEQRHSYPNRDWET
jgi:NADPH:quinone reductase-like Zn-dependent oxidoreductase